MHCAYLPFPMSFHLPATGFSARQRFSSFALSLALLQVIATSPAQALDILNFDLAKTSPPTKQHTIQTSATPAILASHIQPLSFKAAHPPKSNHLLGVYTTKNSPSTTLGQRTREQLLFKGGANSLVAVAVGNAEGTRTAQGDHTPAYSGHRDPGNGAWNQGSFSYQHRASSPENADQKQLVRLSYQAADLRQQAQAQGMELTLLEELSGIDLANQAPLAALDQGGYIDWLQAAKQRQLAANEAIIWARTWSYWDPHLGTWNAPGLGNHWDSIYADQQRRHWAVVQATQQFRL